MKNLTLLSYEKPGNLGTAVQISTVITFHLKQRHFISSNAITKFIGLNYKGQLRS